MPARKGIILAAGRGSRMGERTGDRPKCLVELAGKTLLEWQITALRGAGIDCPAVVCGYRGEAVRAFAARSPVPFVLLENPRWAETNMLSTLLCAAGWAAGEECLISYSDIVYPARHVLALLKNSLPVALTYDRDWEKLWRLRQGGNPLEDAETFREEGGLLQEIGEKPQSLEQVRGQYMGLLKLTGAGWRIWLEQCRTLGGATDTMDMTGFLRRLLSAGAAIGTVPVDGAWCEADSGRDLELYEAALAQGTFSHDWRK